MPSLSGVSTVMWLEGINDFSHNGNATVDAVEPGMRDRPERRDGETGAGDRKVARQAPGADRRHGMNAAAAPRDKVSARRRGTD